MTIEQKIKSKLQTDLTTTFSNYNVKISNDISNHIMNEHDLVLNIKTGQCRLTNITDIIEMATPITIYWKCDSNQLQDVISTFDTYIKANNAEVMIDPLTNEYMKLQFSTPSEMSRIREDTGKDTINVSYGVLLIDAYYNDSFAAPISRSIRIGASLFDLKYLSNYIENIVYNYSEAQTTGNYALSCYDGKQAIITFNYLVTNSVNDFAYYLSANRRDLENTLVVLNEYEGSSSPTRSTNCLVNSIVYSEGDGMPIYQISLKVVG